MKLTKYWNRQHKSLYRLLYIFEAKSMINRDENGGLIKFTKRYQFRCPFTVVEISLWLKRGKIIEFITKLNQFRNI